MLVAAIGLVSLQQPEMIEFILGDVFEPSTYFFPLNLIMTLRSREATKPDREKKVSKSHPAVQSSFV